MKKGSFSNELFRLMGTSGIESCSWNVKIAVNDKGMAMPEYGHQEDWQEGYKNGMYQ